MSGVPIYKRRVDPQRGLIPGSYISIGLVWWHGSKENKRSLYTYKVKKNKLRRLLGFIYQVGFKILKRLNLNLT